jgi:hypothetical protein
MTERRLIVMKQTGGREFDFTLRREGPSAGTSGGGVGDAHVGD